MASRTSSKIRKTSKAQALVESGLATDVQDAKSQLEDMGESNGPVPSTRKTRKTSTRKTSKTNGNGKAPQTQPQTQGPTLEQLLEQREQATSAGVKAALTKKIVAAGGIVPGATRRLTADAINTNRKPNDTVDDLLDRLGFEPNAARRARIAYLVNRAEVEGFELPSVKVEAD